MRDAVLGAPLTRTELIALEDAAAGLCPEASQLKHHLSAHTIRGARRRARQKLGATTITNAVAIAWRRGLIA